MCPYYMNLTICEFTYRVWMSAILCSQCCVFGECPFPVRVTWKTETLARPSCWQDETMLRHMSCLCNQQKGAPLISDSRNRDKQKIPKTTWRHVGIWRRAASQVRANGIRYLKVKQRCCVTPRNRTSMTSSHTVLPWTVCPLRYRFLASFALGCTTSEIRAAKRFSSRW